MTERIEQLEGHLESSDRRFALIAARFNSRVVDLLLAGAVDCLRRHGAATENLTIIRVPGAWELPFALEEAAASGRFDAAVALAVVIRGETPHFDYVAGECCKGISDVGRRYRLPVGMGVLTTDDSSQAVERAGGKAGNKGWEAALAAIEMASLSVQLRGENA